MLSVSYFSLGLSTNPVLVGSDGDVIAGHGRLLAARQLALSEVPVIISDGFSASPMRPKPDLIQADISPRGPRSAHDPSADVRSCLLVILLTRKEVLPRRDVKSRVKRTPTGVP